MTHTISVDVSVSAGDWRLVRLATCETGALQTRPERFGLPSLACDTSLEALVGVLARPRAVDIDLNNFKRTQSVLELSGKIA